jgi:hypothetical protein
MHRCEDTILEAHIKLGERSRRIHKARRAAEQNR